MSGYSINKRLAAAIAGLALTFPLASGCTDNNSGYTDAPSVSEASETAETIPVTTEKAAEEKPVSADDFGSPSEINAQNRPQLLYIMNGGDCVYTVDKEVSDGHKDVYIRDDGKGGKKELDLPENSLLLHTDGENIYYYSPDEGLCSFDGSKSMLLNKETKSAESVPPRENFFFTDDVIFFACDSDKGTVIKSMDYDGKLTDEEYSIEYNGARIVGITEINGKSAFVCTYRIGIGEHVRIFTDTDTFTEINSGDSPYIVDDHLYYLRDRALRRVPLTGGEEEKITEVGCVCFCLYNDKIYYADSTTLYSLDKNGSASAVLTVDDLQNSDFIAGVSACDGRLFVSGGSGANGRSIAEIDESGKVIKTIAEI